MRSDASKLVGKGMPSALQESHTATANVRDCCRSLLHDCHPQVAPATATHNRRCTHPRRRAHSARLGTSQPGRRRKPSCSCCSTSSALMPGGGGEGGGHCEERRCRGLFATCKHVHSRSPARLEVHALGPVAHTRSGALRTQAVQCNIVLTRHDTPHCQRKHAPRPRGGSFSTVSRAASSSGLSSSFR